MRRLAQVAAMVLCACRSESKPVGPGLDWPVPPGWKAETIPFPLDFAPEIKHRGVEELRFSPGMFKPDNDQRFSYAFVWRLEGDEKLSAESLNRDLQRYFQGLAIAVEPKKGFLADQAATTSKLVEKAEGHSFEGTVDTWDPFVSHTRMTLNVTVEVFLCGAAGRTAALFEVSPAPLSNAVWKELDQRRLEFRCGS